MLSKESPAVSEQSSGISSGMEFIWMLVNQETSTLQFAEWLGPITSGPEISKLIEALPSSLFIDSIHFAIWRRSSATALTITAPLELWPSILSSIKKSSHSFRLDTSLASLLIDNGTRLRLMNYSKMDSLYHFLVD